ncbi:MAG TPA: hypothetical protein VK897_06730 [Anaerolineales bacterium]|nr:hypothetical protein [Anaerolineales bacterium]
MILVLAALAGVLSALFIHWFTWVLRLNHLSVTVVAGALSALGLTGFCLLFLNSDIRNMMLIVLVIFWTVALLIGGLQSMSLQISWWKGVLSVFFEMGIAFLAGAAVNLTLQRYISWLDEQFPGIDVYAIINAFLRVLVITLLVLAVARPLIRWKK